MARKTSPANGNAEQVELLRGIWNEIKAANVGIGAMRDELRGEIGALRSEMHTEIGTLRSELQGGLRSVRTELKGEINQLRHLMVESDVRLATEVRDLSVGVRSFSDQVRTWRDEQRQVVKNR